MLNEYLNLSGIDDVKRFCQEEGQVLEIKKNDFFFRKGEILRYCGYVERGAFRFLDYTSMDKPQTVCYSFPGDFVSDYGAFQNQTRATVYAQAIKDSVVYIVTHEELNRFYDSHQDPHIRGKIAEILLAEYYGRLVALYRDTPEERYLNLVRKYPAVLNTVSLKEIASFVGVVPETLSRMRKALLGISKNKQ